MKHVVFLAVASISLALAAPTDPVCIVGAGPTGLTIANGLETQGQQTVLFEKNTEVGGKCQAFYKNGLFHPMGALLFSNETYKETLPVIDASGVPSIPFAYTFKAWIYNSTSGDVQESPASPDQLFPIIMNEAERYIAFWNDEFAPNMTAIGYKNGVPKEYTVTTSQWLMENNYVLLGNVFVAGMVPYGYGDINEVPILYMLQYFTPDILLFFAGQHPGHIIDFHEVFVHYARSSVKGPIHLSTEITKIDRAGANPVITYRNNGGYHTRTQCCSKLILAFPPVLHALEAANLDLSPNEKAIFSPVGITKYWSGAVRVATPDGDIFTAEGEPPEAVGEPVAFIRIFNESDIATIWSWGKYRSNQTLEEAKTLLKSTLSKFNKDPRNTTEEPRPVTNADVKDFKEWDYFPHYDPLELGNGYYDRFNGLQGQMNTYYASGFNGFETVEFAIRAGKDIVHSYFSNL